MVDLRRDVCGDISFLPSLRTGHGREAQPVLERTDVACRTMAGRLLQPTFLAFPVTAMAAPTPYSTGSAPCESSDTD